MVVSALQTWSHRVVSCVSHVLPYDDEARLRSFVVRTTSSGDWSTYLVRLVDPADPDGSSAPEGVDVALATAPFMFTIDCPSNLDCAPRQETVPQPEDLLPGDVHLGSALERIQVLNGDVGAEIGAGAADVLLGGPLQRLLLARAGEHPAVDRARIPHARRREPRRRIAQRCCSSRTMRPSVR